MAILFDDIIFGPIKSRRFGKSLGINLLPIKNKVCNFNCVYCECGWTDLTEAKISYFSYDIICEAIENAFESLSVKKDFPDSITFAGNGEPTMHPQFLRIMETTVKMRNKYLPNVPITVLSNGELLGNKKVLSGLMLADKRVLKLDAGTDKMLQAINLPLSGKNCRWYIDKLKAFQGKLIIQTIFLKGINNDTVIDNTTEKEVNEWLKAIEEIKPAEVMIYTIDRETPLKTLHKVDTETLDSISMKVRSLGINANVYN